MHTRTQANLNAFYTLARDEGTQLNSLAAIRNLSGPQCSAKWTNTVPVGMLFVTRRSDEILRFIFPWLNTWLLSINSEVLGIVFGQLAGFEIL